MLAEEILHHGVAEQAHQRRRAFVLIGKVAARETIGQSRICV